MPGSGNDDSIIPYLTGSSQQRMLVKNLHFKNDKRVGGASNTALEVFIYGRRAEEDRGNWCRNCRADVEIQDCVFEHPATDGIQVANSGDGTIVNLAIRRTRIIGATPRQTGGAVSLNAQGPGSKGGGATPTVTLNGEGSAADVSLPLAAQPKAAPAPTK